VNAVGLDGPAAGVGFGVGLEAPAGGVAPEPPATGDDAREAGFGLAEPVAC
jgi:hypothetical protein